MSERKRSKPLPSRGRSLIRRLVLLLALAALPPLLFVINGTLLAARGTPVMGVTSHEPAPLASEGGEVTILTFNIAKGFAHLGGMNFEARSETEARLGRIASVIRAEEPDLVFLSEVLAEYPGGLNQAEFLALGARMHAWSFGEHYNFGVPGYRVVGGAAILSRWPLEPVTNMDLAGRQPFWVTTNNRRALWCRTTIAGRPVLLASLHNDSFDPATRLEQSRQLLDFSEGRAAIMAGDFNAGPGEEPIGLIRDSERFVASLEGPPTYPAEDPDQNIDLIFAPAGWEVVGHRVIETDASDHRPAVTTFRAR
jgi:endonuclease/exonuclease/phosphatase family metal-dependent hydrolase